MGRERDTRDASVAAQAGIEQVAKTLQKSRLQEQRGKNGRMGRNVVGRSSLHVAGGGGGFV